MSGQTTHSDQRPYTKIESLRGKNPTEIHNNLREVCGDKDLIHNITIAADVFNLIFLYSTDTLLGLFYSINC